MHVRRVFALIFILISMIGLMSVVYAADGFFFIGRGETEDKPQSKLWFNDGTWHGIFSNGSEVYFYKLDNDVFVQQTYPDAFVGTSKSYRADVVWNGTHLFVLMYKSSSTIFFKYSYDATSQRYKRLPGFPVNIPLASGSETATIAQDSTGKLWLAYEADNRIYVLWTTTPDHTVWNTQGFILFEPVDGDDIAAVVAFDNRIGVMWSNQIAQNFGFRIHIDGKPETTWEPVEIVAQGNKIADDHINLAVTDAQDILAATKSAGEDEVNLFVRWIDSGWDGPYFVTHNGTRPIVVFDRENEDVYTFYTDDSIGQRTIAYKVANLSSLIDLALDGSTIVLSGKNMAFNDVTAMKQSVDASTGILIVAKEDVANNAHYRSIDLLPSGPSTNQAPVVNAGPDQTIALPQQATLAGSVHDDGLPLPASLTILWTQLSGPAPATISAPAHPSTTVAFPLPGTYVFRLSASDGVLDATDLLTLIVNDVGESTGLQIPIATLGDDAEEEVSDPNLDSNDLDLGEHLVGLRFGLPVPPGATIVTAYVQFVADEKGSQATTLTIAGEANDNALPFGKNRWNLTERPRTEAAVSWIPPTWANIGDAGLAQRTPELATILQEIVDRPGWSNDNAIVLLFTGSGKRAARPYDAGPSLAPFLHVEYTLDAGSNQPPMVAAGPAQTLTFPHTATLAGTVSDDGLPLPAALSTAWTQLSGPAPVTLSSSTSLTPTVTFPLAGTYVLRLTASDGALTASADVTLTVNPALPTNQPPVVAAGPAQTLTFPQTATLAGTVTDDGLPLPAALSTAWTQLSGPAPVTVSDPTSLTPTVTFPMAGTYSLRLTASDGALSASADVILTVIGTGGTAVVQVQIARSEDDAEERIGRGDMDLDNNDIDLGEKNVGLRFALAVPPGAHIVRSYVQFTTDDAIAMDTTMLVEGEASDNALPFTKKRWNVTDRLRTAATVSWVPDLWPVERQAGPAERTPDLAAIIQEIVHRPGWSSGNALVLIFTGSGHRAAWAYDKMTTLAPVLYVEYAQ